MENKKIAVLFPGQGSQFIGMGREFLKADPEGARLMEVAESISAAPLQRLCFEGPMEDLTRAVNLQPAITAVNMICWQPFQKAGIKADYFAGHSLGEYSALCASGALSYEDALKLVSARGRLSDREGTRNPGGMQAILGLTLEDVEEILALFPEEAMVCVANHNSELQVVISGRHETLARVDTIVSEKGGKAITLNVSIANHSPLIAGAVPDFAKVLAEVFFKAPQKPVLFNVTADTENDTDAIRAIMARQIVSRVRWYEIINSLVAKGVTTFIEVGPKKILTGLNKKIIPKKAGCTLYQVDTPESLAACLAALKAG